VNEEHVREDLAGAEWPTRHLIHDSFVGCRMTGLEAPALIAEHVHFKDCRLELANFRHATLRSVVFEDCVLDEADLGGADIAHCRFAGCSLRGTHIENARLTKVDLRGSQLAPEGDLHALKGATIDRVQLIELAPYLARDIGLTVEDPLSEEAEVANQLHR
jgi:uncharacterized protein YjbI with pentapeptide repeats